MRPADASDGDYLELEVDDDGTVRALRRWFVIMDSGEVYLAAATRSEDVDEDELDTIVMEMDDGLGGDTMIGPTIAPRLPARVR